MKKIKSTLLLLLSSTSFAIAQVGINNTSPAATLDITAKNQTGTASNVDGLLVPRVDRQRAQSMTGIPTSTLIFVNALLPGSQAGITANIDSTGYYYFDGSAWVKLNAASGPAASPVNIYNTDGNLNGNRIVTQAGNTLRFDATATNAFSVDGNTFSVDAANDRIGIGTASPNAKLHLQGNMILGTANTNNGSNLSTVVRDNSTGELQVTNNSPQVLIGGTIGDQIPTSFQDVNTGTIISRTLGTFSFTLSRPSIVNFNASVTALFTAFGTTNTPLTDNSARLMSLFFDFTAAPSGIPLSTDFGENSLTFTNAVSSSLVMTGGNVSASATLSLPAGSYTLRLRGGAGCGNAFRATFAGSSTDMIQVVATPQ